jgi:hypothetical protein
MGYVYGELTGGGLSGLVRCWLQSCDLGDGRLRWAGWVNPAHGHPHWDPAVIRDHRPLTLITNGGQRLKIVPHNTAGFFQSV